ncbi:MAG: hypothetical protein QOH11_2403 [Solirubrobacteraceae bacterium]|jgi:hypothetical protein|nr:hypothetical protein [Solirubrobacteraceae bacterium]
MSPAEALAFEARWRTRAAIGAAAGAVLVLGGGIALVTTLSSSKTDELTSQLLFYDHHSSSLLLGTIVAGLGSICMIAPLVFLFRATKARRPQLPNVALITAWFGPIAAGVGQIALQVVLLDKAHSFATTGAQTYAQAKHLTDEGILKAMQGLVLAGQLSLGFAFVLISLNAMRVGLLTRFMGVLGIIVGVLFVIPLGTLQVVQPFWLLTLTALFLGRWPNGVPPAWQTGKAEPWPTQQEMREQRDKAKAAQLKAAGKAEPEAEPEPAAATASAGPAHPSSKKRKRKRRR